jgi:hypothetical protein
VVLGEDEGACGGQTQEEEGRSHPHRFECLKHFTYRQSENVI